MASTCVGCDNPFERKTKGFNRASVRSFTSPRTFSILLPGKDSYSEGYLCPDCQRQIRSNTVPRQGTKKRTLPSPTYMSAKRARLGQRQNNGPEREMTTGAAVKMAIPYLRKSYFKKALRILVKNSCAARRALIEVHGDILKEEVCEIP